MNVGLNLLGVHGRNGLGETVNGVEAQANGLSVGAMKGPGVIPAHVYNVNAADFIAVGIDVIKLFSGENAKKFHVPYKKDRLCLLYTSRCV